MTENTLKQVSRASRDLNLAASHCLEYFQDYVVSMAAAGNALPVATDATTNVVTTPKTVLYATNIETQTLLAPVSAATGLEIGGDQTNGDGFEINLQNPGNTDGKFLFTVGTEPVGFFIEGQFTVADVSGAAELLIGFRKNEAFAKARATYTDYALIGLTGADIKIATDLNNAGEVLTDTTENAADAGTFTFRVEVTSDGKVSYQVANSSTDTLGTPTVSKDFTFDSTDVLVPVIRFMHGADVAGSVVMNYLKCGYLN
jgi:hypothetical protein